MWKTEYSCVKINTHSTPSCCKHHWEWVSFFYAAGLGFLTQVTCSISVTWQAPCSLKNWVLLPSPLSLMKKDKYGLFFSSTLDWCCDSKSNTYSQSFTAAPQATPAGWPPQTAERALPCCVGWNHSYLTQGNVFGCPWKKAVRDGGRQRAA